MYSTSDSCQPTLLNVLTQISDRSGGSVATPYLFCDSGYDMPVPYCTWSIRRLFIGFELDVLKIEENQLPHDQIKHDRHVDGNVT